MKRIIRLFEGYYHLQSLFVIAQMLDVRGMHFTSPDALLINYETGFPLKDDVREFVTGYATEEAPGTPDDEFSIRDELAVIAHLMRAGQYSIEELNCMEARAGIICETFANLGIDVAEEFPQSFTLDELDAERLRRRNLLN